MGVKKELGRTKFKATAIKNYLDQDTGEEKHFAEMTKRKWKGVGYFTLMRPLWWYRQIETSAGFRMLGYIAEFLPPNFCYLKIEGKHVIANSPIRERTQIHRGLKELEQIGVIMKRRRGEWWVNQKCIRNGTKYHQENPANREIKK